MGEPTTANRRRVLLAGGTILGLVIAAAAWGWSFTGRPDQAWSPEQAKSLQAARDALHAARGEGREVAEDSPDLQKAQAVVNGLEADLEQARDYRGRWATRIAAGGLALTIASGFGYLALRGD